MIQRKIQFDASVRNKFQRCFLLQNLAKMLTKFTDIPSSLWYIILRRKKRGYFVYQYY